MVDVDDRGAIKWAVLAAVGAALLWLLGLLPNPGRRRNNSGQEPAPDPQPDAGPDPDPDGEPDGDSSPSSDPIVLPDPDPVVPEEPPSTPVLPGADTTVPEMPSDRHPSGTGGSHPAVDYHRENPNHTPDPTPVLQGLAGLGIVGSAAVLAPSAATLGGLAAGAGAIAAGTGGVAAEDDPPGRD
jgi:hypothetical protein